MAFAVARTYFRSSAMAGSAQRAATASSVTSPAAMKSASALTALSGSCFSKLGLHAVGTDLIHLVEGDADGIQCVSGKAHALQHPAEDAAVVDVDGEAVETDAQQGAGGHVDQLDLGVGGFVAQDVDVALDELTQAALLGTLGAEHAVGLDDLEGVGSLSLLAA